MPSPHLDLPPTVNAPAHPPANHQLSMTVLMTPDMANFAGNVHGGTILKLLDQVAYACASRYAARYVVTLSVDQVLFLQPVHVGELVNFLATAEEQRRFADTQLRKQLRQELRQRYQALRKPGG